jgi:hypothetical protein
LLDFESGRVSLAESRGDHQQRPGSYLQGIVNGLVKTVRTNRDDDKLRRLRQIEQRSVASLTENLRAFSIYQEDGPSVSAVQCVLR